MSSFQKWGPMLTNVLAFGLIVAGFIAWFVKDQELFKFVLDFGGKSID